MNFRTERGQSRRIAEIRFARYSRKVEKKARDNLKAAAVLMQAQHYDSCASRAYYAAYLAAWDWLVNCAGLQPTSERGDYFRHDRVGQDLLEEGGCNSDERDVFEMLRSWRITADYYRERISPGQASKAVEYSSRFIGRVLDPANRTSQ